MSDFFSTLLDRSLSRAPVLQRRRPSLFEPAPQGYGVGGTVGRSSAAVESENVAEPQPTLRAERFAPANPPPEMLVSEPHPFSRSRADRQSAEAHVAEEFPLTHRALADSAEPISAAATIREAPRQGKNNAGNPDVAVSASRSKSDPHAQTLPVAKAVKTGRATLRRKQSHKLHEDLAPMRVGPRQDNNSGSKPLLAVQAARREFYPRLQTLSVAKVAEKIDSAAPQREPGHKLHVEPESIRPGKKNPVVPAVTTLAPRSIPLPNKSQSAAQQLAAPPPQPTIQVTIGRIEVRAAPAPAASARPARPAAAKLSLEDYLRSRSGVRS